MNLISNLVKSSTQPVESVEGVETLGQIGFELFKYKMTLGEEWRNEHTPLWLLDHWYASDQVDLKSAMDKVLENEGYTGTYPFLHGYTNFMACLEGELSRKYYANEALLSLTDNEAEALLGEVWWNS